MKIAIVSTIEETIPPTKYGGVEWIVYEVAHGLGKKGHTVDLYASGDSEKDEFYNLIPIVEKSIRTLPEFANDYMMRENQKMISYSRAAELIARNNYDVVHNNAGCRFLYFSRFFKTPVVSTIHGPLNIHYQQPSFREFNNTHYISISQNQRKDMTDLNYAATIYNGTNIQDFHLSTHVDTNAPIVFLARFSHEKGGIEAANVAHKLGKKLYIASKVDSVDKDYFAQAQHLIDHEHVEFVGEINLDKKAELLSSARCLLVPIQWEEPFGLMFTEAMASGTPVITFSRGSAPEIVVDGKTGFLINQSDEFIRGDFTIKKTGIEGLIEAVEKIYAMPQDEYEAMRQACRTHVEENFTVEKMVDGYEAAFQKIIAKK